MYAIQFPDASPMNKASETYIIEACNRLSQFCAVSRINPPRIVFDSTQFYEHLPIEKMLSFKPHPMISGIELCVEYKTHARPADTFVDQEIGA